MFIGAPLLWLLLAHLLGQQVVLGWLIVMSAYVAVLVIGSFSTRIILPERASNLK
jgi:predicted membrane-bound spermidine synthase